MHMHMLARTRIRTHRMQTLTLTLILTAAAATQAPQQQGLNTIFSPRHKQLTLTTADTHTHPSWTDLCHQHTKNSHSPLLTLTLTPHVRIFVTNTPKTHTRHC